MEGEKCRKGKGKQSGKAEKSEKISTDFVMAEDQGERDGAHGQNALTAVDMEVNITAIRKDIKMMSMELKTELSNFRDIIRDDLKKELTDFREEIHQKLNEFATDLKTTTDRVSEAEARIAEAEEWSADFREALSQSLQAQESLQLKLTDLEARSRRNNVRIYGIPEGTEGNNIFQFIENFIKKELEPLADVDLGIQRCHRALGPKPPREAQARSVIVYFQQFKIKEMVLHSAWKKKEIFHSDRRIYFDHDYPAETLAKRKAYTQIRRVLKEKGIRFHTPPPAKLRVFFDSGPAITYENAAEATDDLKKRGFTIEREKTAEAAEKARKVSWQRSTSANTANRQTRQERIKEKLQGFHRPR